jgi:bleomycin hydrolase
MSDKSLIFCSVGPDNVGKTTLFQLLSQTSKNTVQFLYLQYKNKHIILSDNCLLDNIDSLILICNPTMFNKFHDYVFDNKEFLSKYSLFIIVNEDLACKDMLPEIENLLMNYQLSKNVCSFLQTNLLKTSSTNILDELVSLNLNSSFLPFTKKYDQCVGILIPTEEYYEGDNITLNIKNKLVSCIITSLTITEGNYIVGLEFMEAVNIDVGLMFTTHNIQQNSITWGCIIQVIDNPDIIITNADLDFWNIEYKKKIRNKVIQNALSHTNFDEIIVNETKLNNIQWIFSHEIDSVGMITDQARTGKCWLYAFMNALIPDMIKKNNLNNFRFSETFIYFYDKLEKCNFILSSIIMADYNNKEKLESLKSYCIKNAHCDGGGASSAVNIILKYGMIPYEYFPDNYQSKNTNNLNTVLSKKMKENIVLLFETKDKEQKIIIKNGMVKDIYNILRLFLGTPPTIFTWEYYDTYGTYRKIKDLTPKEFYKSYVPIDLKQYVTLTLDYDIKINTYNTVNYLNNIMEACDHSYLSSTIERMKQLCVQNIINGSPILISCHSQIDFNQELCILDPELYSTDIYFGNSPKISRKIKSQYGITSSDHIMTIIGCNILKTINGRYIVDKWKLKNSWGIYGVHGGFCYMTDKWFDENVFDIFVDIKYLNDKEIKGIQGFNANNKNNVWDHDGLKWVWSSEALYKSIHPIN